MSSVFSSIVLPSIFSFVSVFGLLGNGLVLYAMSKVKQKSITDIYITNLSVADFLFVASLPFWTVDFATGQKWIFGEIMCRLVSGCTYIHMYASIFFLALMSIDRVQAVVFYKKSKNRSTKTAKSYSISLWIFAAVLSIVPCCFRTQIEIEKGVYACTWDFGNSNSSNSTSNWLLVYVFERSFIGFVIPTILMVVSYITMAIFLCKRQKRAGSLTAKKQRKATIVVLAVVGVFLLCWMPNQISAAIYSLQAFKVIDPPDPSMKAVYDNFHFFSLILAWGHSCINPILYTFLRHNIVSMAYPKEDNTKHSVTSSLKNKNSD